MIMVYVCVCVCMETVRGVVMYDCICDHMLYKVATTMYTKSMTIIKNFIFWLIGAMRVFVKYHISSYQMMKFYEVFGSIWIILKQSITMVS